MPELATKRLRVNVDSKLAKLVKEASATGEPVVIDTGEAEYALRVEGRASAASGSGASKDAKESIWADYDPEAALAAFRRTAGSWSDVDADELIANIYRWREEGSRPADRP